MKYKLLIIVCYVILESFIAYAIWQTIVLQDASKATKIWEIALFIITGVVMSIWLKPTRRKDNK